MDAGIIEYFTAIAEGQPGMPNWHDWLLQHDEELRQEFPRTRYLRLKFHPLKEIEALLGEQGVRYTPSAEYAWLDGIPGRCRYCGAETRSLGGGGAECPHGCFRLIT